MQATNSTTPRQRHGEPAIVERLKAIYDSLPDDDLIHPLEREHAPSSEKC